jgi:tripartite-type tricarboxylate transporter receptor subunit TctC
MIVGPKNIDRSIVMKLTEAFSETIDSPDFVRFAKQMDTWAPKFLSGDELGKEIFQRFKRNEELFRRLGMGIK